MNQSSEKTIESVFFSLSANEKRAIISSGAAIYLSSLKKGLFLARAKIREFEEKYGISLEELDEKGLPDDADFQMHEDYLMWHHWEDKSRKYKRQIKLIEPIVARGLYPAEVLNVCD